MCKKLIDLVFGNESGVDIDNFENDLRVINSKDAFLTMMIHLGYLTYNLEDSTCRIPNCEIEKELMKTLVGINESPYKNLIYFQKNN